MCTQVFKSDPWLGTDQLLLSHGFLSPLLVKVNDIYFILLGLLISCLYLLTHPRL